jgi:hypothetical protein
MEEFKGNRGGVAKDGKTAQHRRGDRAGPKSGTSGFLKADTEGTVDATHEYATLDERGRAAGNTRVCRPRSDRGRVPR